MDPMIPFGYKIINGKAYIEKVDDAYIKEIYSTYLKCQIMAETGRLVKPNRGWRFIKKILTEKRYCGDDFYPEVIDKETFEDVKKIMTDKSYEQPRSNKLILRDKIRDINRYSFSLSKCIKKIDDPYLQAEYVYSQIKEEFDER